MFGTDTKGNVFFDLFVKSAQNAHQTAKLLADLLDNYDDVANKVRQIKNLEHQGDDYTHRILESLAKTFITPLDREDIQRAASRLDGITDQIDTAANRMMLFKIVKPTEDAKAFAAVLVRATATLIDAFEKLRNLKKSDAVVNCCVEVRTQETEGDRIMQHAMAGLFEGPDLDPVEIIKWKDIYRMLEKAVNRCEDVADVLQTIVVKYA